VSIIREEVSKEKKQQQCSRKDRPPQASHFWKPKSRPLFKYLGFHRNLLVPKQGNRSEYLAPDGSNTIQIILGNRTLYVSHVDSSWCSTGKA
jgi:hypothetical protein